MPLNIQPIKSNIGIIAYQDRRPDWNMTLADAAYTVAWAVELGFEPPKLELRGSGGDAALLEHYRSAGGDDNTPVAVYLTWQKHGSPGVNCAQVWNAFTRGTMAGFLAIASGLYTSLTEADAVLMAMRQNPHIENAFIAALDAEIKTIPPTQK